MSNKTVAFLLLYIYTATVVLLGFKTGLIFFLISMYLQQFHYSIYLVQMWMNGYTFELKYFYLSKNRSLQLLLVME